MLPDVPSFIEAGVPNTKPATGRSAPAGTPQPIIDKLHKALTAVQDMPDVQQQMENRGAAIDKMGIAEFGAFMESETAKWTNVIKTAGIKAQ